MGQNNGYTIKWDDLSRVEASGPRPCRDGMIAVPPDVVAIWRENLKALFELRHNANLRHYFIGHRIDD